MNLLIREESCLKNGLCIGDVLVLTALANNISIKDSINKLISIGFITSIGESINGYRVTNKGLDALNNSTIDSIEYKKEEEDRFTSLANKLRELYPSGRKDGTSYMWRGTTAEIVRKLKALSTKYKFDFSDEQAVNATKTYVSSFNGNYRYMQLLKYFILKAVRDADGNTEIKSEFMSLIENEGQTNNRDDWMSTMV